MLKSTKGTKQNPILLIVREESSQNHTLTLTLSKSVSQLLKIKKGDKLQQWADIEKGIVCIKKI